MSTTSPEPKEGISSNVGSAVYTNESEVEIADKPSNHDTEEEDLSVSQDQILPVAPDRTVSCPMPPQPPTEKEQYFFDDIGKNVLTAFHNLEHNVGKLKQNLERQFNDSEEDEEDFEDEDAVELDECLQEQLAQSRGINRSRSSTTSSGVDADDMNDLINALNRHDKMLEEKNNFHHLQQKSTFFTSSSSNGKYSPSDDDAEEEEEGEFDDEDDNSNSSNSRGNNNFVGKIFDLINTLQQREVNPTVDEWDNDDDAGYITISLSEQEFVEFEEVGS